MLRIVLKKNCPAPASSPTKTLLYVVLRVFLSVGEWSWPKKKSYPELVSKAKYYQVFDNCNFNLYIKVVTKG